MAIELEDWELPTLANPLALYEAVTVAKGYSQKPQNATGDCELFISDLAIRDCVVACTLVHAKREAYLVLLSSEDLTGLRERLAEVQLSLNTSRLVTGPRRLR